jgi:RimJ/RimL family protein N-acetyltransferase
MLVWMHRPAYPIATPRLRLRPFRPDDLDALHALQSHPDVVRYLYWDARTRDEVRAVLEDRLRRTVLAEEGDRVVLAVERADTGEMVGDASLAWRSRAHRQGEVGFVLHPDHHGRGFGLEAGGAMLRLGFEGLGLHRIFGRCDARNAASARLMERLGMRLEAHFRENEVFKGAWGDELVYAMLRREWEGRRPRA